MKCPQNEQEFQAYFFNLIQREIGDPADDWRAVMSMDYIWENNFMQIPPGVGPGVIQPADAPFYGLTQQWSGGPKTRIFLPSPEADDNGYYTRCIQYIKDAPGGGFVWSWTYISGNEYAPICDGEEPVPPSDIEQRVETLEAQVSNLEDRVAALEALITNPTPKKIALIADNGKYVTAEVTTPNNPLRARGDKPDAWQQFIVVVLE